MALKIITFLKRITHSRLKDVDAVRRNFILNVLLISVIFLLIFDIILTFINSFLVDPVRYGNNTLSFAVLFLLLFFFISLYILSQKGFFRCASALLLSVFFLLASYAGYFWGIELPSEILFYVLIIVMAGTLYGSMTNTFTVADPITITLTAPAPDAVFDNLTQVTGSATVSGGTAPYSVQFYLDNVTNGTPVTSAH